MPISSTTTTQLGIRVRFGIWGPLPPWPLLLFGVLLPPGGCPDGRLPPPLFGSCMVPIPLIADNIVGPLDASRVDILMDQRGLQTRMAALTQQRQARNENRRGNGHIASTVTGTKSTPDRRVCDIVAVANGCGRS